MSDSAIPVRKGRGFAAGGSTWTDSSASIRQGSTKDPGAGDSRRGDGDRRRSRSRSRSRSRERDRRDRRDDRDRHRSRSRERRRSRSRSHDRGRYPPPPPPPPSHGHGAGNPAPGSVIIMSNTRKTAEAVAKAQSGGGVVGEDAIAALRAKVAAVTAMQAATFGLAVPTVPGLQGLQAGATLAAQGGAAASAGGLTTLPAVPTGVAPAATPSLGVGPGMGMPSGTIVIQGPAGGMINVGASPAQAAGMLGTGGLVSLLAAVAPTRVLVLYNAFTDAILETGRAAPTNLQTELADVVLDIAGEAQKAAPGQLLRVVVPLPSVKGELIDPPVGVKLGGTIKVVGAQGLLEDKQDKDQGILTIPTAHGKIDSHEAPVVVGANMLGAKVIPITAEAFYRKVAGGNWSAGLETLPDRPSMGAGTGSAGAGGGAWTQEQEHESEPAEPSAGTGGFADDGRTRGLGKLFLEFHSVDAAISAQKELAGRFYEGRILVATFAHPAKWSAGDLCALGPPGAFVMTKSNAPAALEQPLPAAPASAVQPVDTMQALHNAGATTVAQDAVMPVEGVKDST